MKSITKRFQFDYAHKLPDYHGKCANLHGHLGILEVEISDSYHNELIYNGMIIDFIELKKIVDERIIEKLDHRYLNEVLPVPTAENICNWIVDQLEPIFGVSLVRIRAYETPDSYAEWKR